MYKLISNPAIIPFRLNHKLKENEINRIPIFEPHIKVDFRSLPFWSQTVNFAPVRKLYFESLKIVKNENIT